MSERGRREREPHRTALLVVYACFVATLLAGVGFLVVLLFLGGDTQVEGILAAVALGGLGAGLVIWAHRLMPTPILEERRHLMASSAEMREALTDELLHSGVVGRRRVLGWLLASAVAVLAAVVLAPLLSLGPRPGSSLATTSWRRGLRLVGLDGQPVMADDVALGTLVTVFPEGFVNEADSQAVLLHLDPATLELTDDALAGAPDGFVAYSKLCTHAGCPVGLFLTQTRHLSCPCHQSTFDVLRGAEPVFGPAPRALPQLPLRLEEDGTITATGDFPEPVGPGYWDMTA